MTICSQTIQRQASADKKTEQTTNIRKEGEADTYGEGQDDPTAAAPVADAEDDDVQMSSGGEDVEDASRRVPAIPRLAQGPGGMPVSEGSLSGMSILHIVDYLPTYPYTT